MVPTMMFEMETFGMGKDERYKIEVMERSMDRGDGE